MSDYPSLSRIILSSPSLLAPAEGAPASSWIQVARTGDHQQQIREIRDYERRLETDAPQFQARHAESPDGAPSRLGPLVDEAEDAGRRRGGGLVKVLSCARTARHCGAEVQWTPKAAEAIENKEYQFVSIVREGPHDKDGTKIGTTLLAAAITNHPYLEIWPP